MYQAKEWEMVLTVVSGREYPTPRMTAAEKGKEASGERRVKSGRECERETERDRGPSERMVLGLGLTASRVLPISILSAIVPVQKKKHAHSRWWK